MSKNDKQQQSNADAAASRSGCVHKVLDTQRRFIDDLVTLSWVWAAQQPLPRGGTDLV